MLEYTEEECEYCEGVGYLEPEYICPDCNGKGKVETCGNCSYPLYNCHCSSWSDQHSEDLTDEDY